VQAAARKSGREWEPVADDLACSEQLSKTRDVMSIFLMARPIIGGGVDGGRVFGRGASSLLLAVVACAALACSDDETDPADQTGAAGGVSTPDAAVRDLPGDGLERTPDFDTNTSQREPIGPQDLVKEIERIRNGIGGGDEDAGAAAPVDASDAGAN
jgi:hypothetical protein